MSDVLATVELSGIDAYLAAEDIQQTQWLVTMHGKLARVFDARKDTAPDCIAVNDAKAGQIVFTASKGVMISKAQGDVNIGGNEDE